MRYLEGWNNPKDGRKGKTGIKSRGEETENPINGSTKFTSIIILKVIALKV